VYFNDPLRYLPSLTDPEVLAPLRESYFVLCHGRGAWEEHGHEAAALAEHLHRKGITCWYDVWGERYPHDWPSWREQLVKFVGVLRDGVLFAGADDGRLRLVGPGRVQRSLGRPVR
jgi:esterase/lipase superfamily enzyme